jgi:uncharacterized membrane protein
VQPLQEQQERAAQVLGVLLGQRCCSSCRRQQQQQQRPQGRVTPALAALLGGAAVG